MVKLEKVWIGFFSVFTHASVSLLAHFSVYVCVCVCLMGEWG